MLPRRPKPKTDGYQNAAMTRDQALNFVIDAGLIVQPMRIEIRASGQGFDAILPVEGLCKLAAKCMDMGKAKA